MHPLFLVMLLRKVKCPFLCSVVFEQREVVETWWLGESFWNMILPWATHIVHVVKDVILYYKKQVVLTKYSTQQLRLELVNSSLTMRYSWHALSSKKNVKLFTLLSVCDHMQLMCMSLLREKLVKCCITMIYLWHALI